MKIKKSMHHLKTHITAFAFFVKVMLKMNLTQSIESSPPLATDNKYQENL